MNRWDCLSSCLALSKDPGPSLEKKSCVEVQQIIWHVFTGAVQFVLQHRGEKCSM